MRTCEISLNSGMYSSLLLCRFRLVCLWTHHLYLNFGDDARVLEEHDQHEQERQEQEHDHRDDVDRVQELWVRVPRVSRAEVTHRNENNEAADQKRCENDSSAEESAVANEKLVKGTFLRQRKTLSLFSSMMYSV